MFTSGVTRSLRDAHRAEQTATRLGRQLMSGQKIQTASDDPATWLEGKRSQSTAGFLDTIHTGLVDTSTSVQIADTTMQAIGKHLDIMSGTLRQALEYPAGDVARQQAVASFNGVLQQIDDMVYTTPQTGARNLLSGVNVAVLVGLRGEQKIVHAQRVDSSAAGLKLAALAIHGMAQSPRRAPGK